MANLNDRQKKIAKLQSSADLLLFKEIEKAVHENKLFYKQRFIDLEDRIDLNTITEILNNYEIMNSFKTSIPINPNDVFSYTFQMKGVEKHPTIWNLHNLMKNNISSCDIDRTDLFAAFKNLLAVIGFNR